MNTDIPQPTIEDIRKLGESKRPTPKKPTKPRPRITKKKSLPPPPEPEPIIESETEEDVVKPTLKHIPEIADNQLELIKYIIDNSNDKTKKELIELKEYISSQQQNIIDVFKSLKPTKPKPKPRPKPKPKPTKSLDLTITDKDI